MIGKERGPEWYDNKYSRSEKLVYQYKSGLYVKAYGLFSEGNILDIGCGSGRFAKVLYDNNFDGEYLGIDFSKNAIDYCKKIYPYEFRVDNVFDISMDRFDNVVLLELFEHVINDICLVERVCKDLIFSVPSFGGPSHVRYFKNIYDVKERYQHLLEFESEIKIDRIFLFKGLRKNG